MYSIIAAIYKIEKYLPQCIESVLAQTHTDFEFILVDDGSPDACPQICDEYAAKDSRIKVIHKKNGGLVSARKAGLKAAQGEYVCFIDGDDFISSDMLETYERELQRQKVDIICTGYSSYYGEHKAAIKTFPNGANKIYSKSELQQEIYPKMLSDKLFFSFYISPNVWSKCLKKSIAETVYKTIPDEISLGEDVAVTYPVLLEAESVSIINYTGYMYRQNLSSMTHTYDKDLYPKIRNLILYLKSVENRTSWQAGNQINEYAVFLLILAKNNEFKYNLNEKYKVKRKNMKKYLSDSLFVDALKNVRLKGIRNNFILFCFKHRLTLPIDIYEQFAKRSLKSE